MVKIRLKRLGRKHRPFYRIVVTDIRNRRDGEPLVELGFYNPISKQLKLDKQAALEWIAKGARPSEAAQRLINKADESGELIQLEVAKKQRLSKKAKAAEEARKAAEEAEKAAPPPAVEEPVAEAPAAEEVSVEEAPAEETAPAEA